MDITLFGFLRASPKLSLFYLYIISISVTLYLFEAILSNTTLYFIFIFIKIIFLLFYFNFFFFSLYSFLAPPLNPPRSAQTTTPDWVSHPRHRSVSHQDRRANPRRANPKHPRPTPKSRPTKQRSVTGMAAMAGLHLERTKKRGRAEEKKIEERENFRQNERQ